jgi:hypothetical protein
MIGVLGSAIILTCPVWIPAIFIVIKDRVRRGQTQA